MKNIQKPHTRIGTTRVVYWDEISARAGRALIAISIVVFFLELNPGTWINTYMLEDEAPDELRGNVMWALRVFRETRPLIRC